MGIPWLEPLLTHFWKTYRVGLPAVINSGDKITPFPMTSYTIATRTGTSMTTKLVAETH